MTTLESVLATKAGEAGIDTAKEGLKEFCQKVIGPYLEAWGENLAVGVKVRMYNNLFDVVAKANKKARDAGIDPKQVPLKLIHPLLEAASVEETSELQDVWANMMLNAADTRGITPVTVTFPNILRELSSHHVRFLSALSSDLRTRQFIFGPPYTLQQLQLFYCRDNISSVDIDVFLNLSFESQEGREFKYMLDLLKRHNVLEESIYHTLSKKEWDEPQITDVDMNIDAESVFYLTEIGESFITACETPKSVSKPSTSS